MNNIILGIDFINACSFIKNNNFVYLWPDNESFIQDSNYPYHESTLILSYEPFRNIFVVERYNTGTVSGNDLPEIVWIQNNIARLYEIANTRYTNEQPVTTMEDLRQAKLYETDWVLIRKQEQDLLGNSTEATDQLFQAVLAYRQELRDLSTMYAKNSPADQVDWPINPLSNQ
jgi:hypothetical protein